MKKKLLVTIAAIGLCLTMLTGCGDTRDKDGEYITLNKCDDTDEFLCDVLVPDGYSYDRANSEPDDGYFYLDHEDGGYIYISNGLSGYYGYLYSYLFDAETGEDVSGYTEFDMEVIGTAFGRSDCMYIEDEQYDCTYIAIEYSDDGYVEYLVVDFEYMDVDGWSKSDYLDLAKELFGN